MHIKLFIYIFICKTSLYHMYRFPHLTHKYVEDSRSNRERKGSEKDGEKPG